MAILVACCLNPAIAQGPPQKGPPPALVQVGIVTQEELQNHWPVVGRLQEVRRAIVAAEEPGRVIKVVADEGKTVKTGDVLLRIDDVWAQLAVEAAGAKHRETKADVAEASANLQQAQSDLKLTEDLHKAGSAKLKELNDARAKVAAEQARLEKANAQVSSAEVEIRRASEQLARLTIVAPFNGVVVRKLTELGQWATAGTPVIEIVSLGTIDAVIDVPETLVNNIKPNQTIEVVIEPLIARAAGRVHAIVPVGSTAARTFPVKVRIDDDNGKLKAGMSVTAMVPMSAKSKTLTIPRDAVLSSPDGTYVWGDVGGKAMKINIDILFGHADRYAVRVSRRNAGPPLRPQMNVVIEGGERILFPGQPLKITGEKQVSPARDSGASGASGGGD